MNQLTMKNVVDVSPSHVHTCIAPALDGYLVSFMVFIKINLEEIILLRFQNFGSKGQGLALID